MELLRWLYQLNELINLLPVGFQMTVQYIQQSWELFYYSKGKSFLILSDSLSSLQSIFNLKYDHPVLVQILELYTEMTREGSDLKPCTNKYILELWQSEWDEFPENKLYNIFPILKECIFCPRTNRKEETVMAWLHIGHSFLTHSFLLKGEEPPMCIGCDKCLTLEHILLTC